MRRTRLRPLLAAAASLCVSCGGGSASPDGSSDAAPDLGHVTLRLEVATSIATNVILPALEGFETLAAALETAAAAYAAAPLDMTARTNAQDAWRAAMTAWQWLELMQVGPASPATVMMGGMGIRAEIYAWPDVAGCRIDEETAEGAYADVDAFAAELAWVRGLGAMEHLLFREGTATVCAAAPAGWLTDLDAHRAAYAHTLAILVHRQATRLHDAWAPESGNYVAAIATAGAGSTVYDTAQEALNAVSNAMYYLDVFTKDMKLGIPTGVNAACTDTGAIVCPDAVESPWADASIDHVRENLVAFRAILIGGEPGTTNPGFDDLLIALGQQALVDRLLAEIDEAIAATAVITEPLEDVVLADRTPAVVLYGHVKDITDLLKSDFISVLDLEPPMNAAGDND